jgi:hypothetical protein
MPFGRGRAASRAWRSARDVTFAHEAQEQLELLLDHREFVRSDTAIHPSEAALDANVARYDVRVVDPSR